MEIINYEVIAIGDNLDRLQWDISPYETIKDRVRLFTKPNNQCNRRLPVISGTRFNLVNFTFNPVEKSKVNQYKITGSIGLSEYSFYKGIEHLLIELSFKFPDVIFLLANHYAHYLECVWINNGQLLHKSSGYLYKFNKDHSEEGGYEPIKVNTDRENIFIERPRYLEDREIILSASQNLKPTNPLRINNIDFNNEKAIYLPTGIGIVSNIDNKVQVMDSEYQIEKNSELLSGFGIKMVNTKIQYKLEYNMTYLVIDKSLGLVDKFMVDNNLNTHFDTETNFFRYIIP